MTKISEVTGQNRILIEQDDLLLSQIIGDLSQFQGAFQRVIDTYGALQIGEMSPAVFEEIKAGDARLSVKRYEKQLNDDLDRTKVYNLALRSNLLHGTEEVSRKFFEAVREFLAVEVKPKEYNRRELNPESKLTLDFVDFKEGSLYISEASREGITEKHCRHYIETQEEHELYEIAQSIAEGYKAVVALSKKYSMSLNTSNLHCMHFLFKDIGADISVNGPQIAGLSSRLNSMLKYRK